MNLRRIQENDIPQLVELCELHANYEKATFNAAGKGESLSRALFAESPHLFCWVVAQNEQLQGYMSATKEFSTWEASFFVHMDCLYLKPETRGFGLGIQLINQLKQFAVDNNCQLIQWQTPSDNKLGIQFYEKLGTSWKSKRRYFLPIQVNGE